MMTISEFAMSTGLTAKTLRFYDERGILTPADVDPRTGYRRYSAAQMRDATTIRVLRAAGMPLEQIGAEIVEPDRQDQLVRAHTRTLAAERSVQDRALAVAERLRADLADASQPETREMPATHWVAATRVIRLDEIEEDSDPSGDGPLDEEANEMFGRLFTALRTAGNPPVGQFWTSMPAQISAESVELRFAWPVEHPVPADFAVEGLTLRRGTLPARTEAYVVITGTDAEADMLDDLPGGRLADPHFIAFSEYLEARGVMPHELRQTTAGTGREDWTIDYAATLAEY